MSDQEKLMKLFAKQRKISAKVEKLKRKIAKQQQEEEKAQAREAIESLGLVFGDSLPDDRALAQNADIPLVFTPMQRAIFVQNLEQSGYTHYAHVDIYGTHPLQRIRFVVYKLKEEAIVEFVCNLPGPREDVIRLISDIGSMGTACIPREFVQVREGWTRVGENWVGDALGGHDGLVGVYWDCSTPHEG